MPQYVGLDVSVKSVSICVVDAQGAVIARGETSADPEQISSFIGKHAPRAERVVHESGILAIWLTRELDKRGRPITCIDARLAHKVLSGRINKSDAGTPKAWRIARAPAGSARSMSEAKHRVRVLIGTRERLIRMRKDPEEHVRGVPKVFWVCMGAVHRTKLRQAYRDQLAEAAATDPAIDVMAGMFNPIHEALCAATEAMHEELRAIACESALPPRLMTVPGRRSGRRALFHRYTG